MEPLCTTSESNKTSRDKRNGMVGLLDKLQPDVDMNPRDHCSRVLIVYKHKSLVRPSLKPRLAFAIIFLTTQNEIFPQRSNYSVVCLRTPFFPTVINLFERTVFTYYGPFYLSLTSDKCTLNFCLKFIITFQDNVYQMCIVVYLPFYNNCVHKLISAVKTLVQCA